MTKDQVCAAIESLSLDERRAVMGWLLTHYCAMPNPGERPCPEEHIGEIECDACAGSDVVEGLPCGKLLDDCDGEHPLRDGDVVR